MARRYNDGYDDRGNDRYDDRYNDRYDDQYADDGYADDGYDDEGYTDEGYDDYADGYGDNYRDDRYDRSYGRSGRYEDDYEDEDYDDRYEDDAPRGRASRGNSRRSSGRDTRKSSGSKGGKKRIILFVVEIAVLLVVIVVLYFVTSLSKAGKANIAAEDIEANISEEAKASAETGAMKGYRNIALFGVDSTEGDLDKNTRSDTIIICSINEDTGEIKLVSVYRDTFLYQMTGSDTNYNKANTAYATGGPEQAIAMLNSNLDLNISDFVTVGFGGLTDVINALGGIELNIEEDEISHLNNYQSTMAQELGMKYTEVTEPGLQTVDGLQATAYCRVRYTSGWDYKRAARQRAVIYAVLNKAKQASPTQLADIASNVFKEIYTSYDLSDIITDVQAVANYSVAAEDSIDTMSNGFPQQDLRIQANLGNALGDCVVPRSLAENVQWLHGLLFGDDDYQVSNTVQTYSDYIDEFTKDAVPEEMTDADHT